jgi:hypothetical protein
MSAKVCSECRAECRRLRRERCNACYMRLYRSGEVTEGTACNGCGERRRELLCTEEMHGTQVVVCGNCALVLRRTRPRLGSVAELRTRMTRERRAGRGPVVDDGKRASDRLPAPSRPGFDVSCD